MPDREKVIKGLEYCMGGCQVSCFNCPYRDPGEVPPDCLDNCRILQDAVELLKEQPKWINVKDRLPEIDVTVLVYAQKKTANMPYSPKMVITRMSNVNFLDCKTTTDPYWISPWQCFFEHYEITHWMLPNPPKGGEVGRVINVGCATDAQGELLHAVRVSL